MTKQYAIAALFATAVLLMSYGNVAFAATDTHTSLVQHPAGKMIKSVGKTKQKVSPLSSNPTTSSAQANWYDCNSNYLTATESFLLQGTPNSQVNFKWSWPSSTYVGVYPLCINAGFSALQHALNDQTQNWTLYSTPVDTAYSQPNWQTYNLVDNNGNPIYIYQGDVLNISTTACYGGTSGGTNCSFAPTAYFTQVTAN